MKSPFEKALRRSTGSLEEITRKNWSNFGPVLFAHNGSRYLYLARCYQGVQSSQNIALIALQLRSNQVSGIDVIYPSTQRVQSAKDVRSIRNFGLEDLVFFPIEHAAWVVAQLAKNPEDKQQVRAILEQLWIVVMNQPMAYHFILNMINTDSQLRGTLSEEFIASYSRYKKPLFDYLPELIIALIKIQS